MAMIVVLYPGRSNFQLAGLVPYADIIFEGWGLTIFISVLTLLFSTVLGFVLYLLTKSKLLFLRYIASIFNEIVFGSPTIVFFLVVYYFIGVPLGLTNRLVVGVVAFGLYMSPYMKNLFVGAMESIDDLQHQAMRVFGFTPTQQYRYIILPQILKLMIPPMIGNLTFIVKGSALLNFIGVQELYNQITTAQSGSYAVVEGYLVMFVLYLLITIPLIRVTKYFEKRVTSWNLS
ncbi:MAG: ABC transporter permease subunit [Bacillus subtilis]|nr:ABC transporter permease subunit [Bacillus subtilis]